MIRKGILLLSIFYFVAIYAFAQTDGDYRSRQTGNWNTVTTWQVFNSAAWHNLEDAGAGAFQNVTPTSSSGAITLQSGFTVTIPSSFSVTVDQVSVSINGTLTIASGGTLTAADGTGTDLSVFNDGFDFGFLTVNGTLINNDNATITGTDGTNATFNSGGVYRHLYTTTEGTIPIASWNLNSTVEIQGYTGSITASAGGNWGQNFGNFVFNCSNLGSGVMQLAGRLTSIQNDLTVSSTGTSGSFRFSSSEAPTISIGRDLTISGTSRVLFGSGTTTTVTVTRDFVFTSTNSTGTNFATTGATTITVTRDFSMNATGGRLNFASSGSAELNVTGNFTLTSGTIFFGSAGSATGTLKITGNFSNAGTLDEGSLSASAGNIDFIGSGTHTFSNTGTINNTINFSVASLSTLDLGTSIMTGSGSFTLNGTARLGATDAAGALQTGSSGGNIRVTGTRTYASNSTITYNGTSAQFIGNGFPSGGDVNLTINNANNVTLSDNLDIVALRTLTLTSGNIVIGAQTLTINGTVTGSGGMVGGTSSNLTIGGTGNFGTLTFSGTNQLNNFTLNRTSSGLVTLGGNLTILGTFTHTAGTLAIASNTFTISGAYGPATPGNFSVTSSSSIIVDGTGTLPSDVGLTGTTLGTLTLNRASTTLTTTSSITINNLNLTSGTFSNGTGITIGTGGTITREGGSMSSSPNNTTNSYNVVYTSGAITTGPELPSNTTALNNLSKTGSGTLTLGSNITINGVLTLSSGSFSAGTNTIDLKGDFASNAASTLTSTTVTFSGTTTISGSSTPTFGAVVVSGTLTPSSSFQINGNLTNNGTLNSGSGTTIFGGTTTISGSNTCSFNNLQINASSALTGPSNGTINVAGNFTNSGTFTHNNGTVNFNGTTSITGTVNFNSLTVSGTLNAPATLNVAGNFTNSGTFNRGTGTVVFNGSSTQSISGSSTTDFNNISVTNTAGPPAVQIQSNQNLRGTLTLSSNAVFDADGSAGTSVFTLISTADSPTSDAGIAALPTGASVTGNVTVQRYMSIEGTGSRMYRYISSPVQTPAVSQIQTEIPVTGTFTGASSCTGCNSSKQSMFRYDETVTTGDLNTGFVDFPDIANSETLATGGGYTIYVRGNIDPVSSAGSARWDVRAPINSGTVSFPATFTSSGTPANDGWNLVGNPYPSTIDWDAASGWTRTSVNNAIYMRDNATGVVASYVGGVPNNGGSRYIPMGQGFFVQSTASPTFSCTESVKVAGQQTTFFREQTLNNILRITLRQGNKHDESVVRFTELATEGFDGSWDAHKLKNEIFNLSSVTSTDLKLSINSLPKLSCGTTVNLDISDITTGGYQIEFTEFESFSDAVEIYLHDLYTNSKVNARDISSYTFEVTSDPLSFGKRFSVSFSYTKPVEALVDASTQVCQGQQAMINIENSEDYVAYSMYKNGSAITEAVYGNGGSLQIPLNASFLSGGDNEFILHYSPANCNAMLVKKTIKIKSFDILSVTTKAASHCGSGSVSLSATGAEDGSYRWYETADATTSIEGQTGPEFITPILNKTKTYYVSAINALGCEGERVAVAAEIINYDDVLITIDGQKLVSSYASGNQWYLNGEPITDAMGQTLEVKESGLYEVEVMVNGCTTRAAQEMIVTAIEGNGSMKGVKLYPNPVEDNLVIELPQQLPAEGDVRTSLGQGVGPIKFKPISDKMKGEFSFQNHAPGLYLIRITQGNLIMNYKIIKK